MSVSTWDREVARYVEMTASERQHWLGRLLFALTVLARDTYAVGKEGLDDPVRMRRFNELMHRTASQLCAHIENKSGRPDEIFLKIVEEEMTALNIQVSSLLKMLA